jgi:hypothetical protein
MLLLAIASGSKWLRRAILALAQRAERSRRSLPPEIYRFPPF